MTGTAVRSRILTLVFTDLADSTALKLKHGDQAAAGLMERHRTIVVGLCAQSGGLVIDSQASPTRTQIIR